MKKTEQQLFLQVKEQLDYYKLPTIFPYEALDLLSKILSLMDKHGSKNDKENVGNKGQDSCEINDALKNEIGKVIKENNRLHNDLMTSKQEVLTLKYQNDKLLIQRSGGTKQTTLLLQAQRRREDQLFQELTQVKYKYNELMDLVHEDPNVEKQYIKRLMKHRKLQINQRQQIDEKMFKRGPHQTASDLESKVILLQNKLANRESQIMRLQKRSEFDGLNLNKILKDFQNSRNDSKISALEQQINHLEQQNKKMRDEVKYCRGTGGSKEALREQNRKNQETISKLLAENKDLKQKLKQNNFDINSKTKLGNREVEKAKDKQKHVTRQNQTANRKIADLNKKVQFLQGELDQLRVQYSNQQKLNVEKDILIDQLKNSEEGDKILGQYEIQSLKQRAQELETNLQNSQERLRELESENDYHKKEDRLKNEAIENLQKIVDELMKRKSTNDFDSSHINLQNTMALRRNLAQTKELLNVTIMEKQRQKRQVTSLSMRLEHAHIENKGLNEELSILKIKIADLRTNQRHMDDLDTVIGDLRSALKKQENLRYQLQQRYQQSEIAKSNLRKQLQQISQQFQIFQKKTKIYSNSLKNQVQDLEQQLQLQNIKFSDKDNNNHLLHQQLEELSIKVKSLKQELEVSDEEKQNLAREKMKIHQKYEELLTLSNINQIPQPGSNLSEQIAELQRQKEKLRQRISNQNMQIMQFKSIIQSQGMNKNNDVEQDEEQHDKKERNSSRYYEGKDVEDEEQEDDDEQHYERKY